MEILRHLIAKQDSYSIREGYTSFVTMLCRVTSGPQLQMYVCLPSTNTLAAARRLAHAVECVEALFRLKMVVSCWTLMIADSGDSRKWLARALLSYMYVTHLR